MTSTEPRQKKTDTGTTERSRTSETVTKILVFVVALGAVFALVAHFGYGWNPGESEAPSLAGGPAATAPATPEVTPKAVAPLVSSVPTSVSVPSIGANSSLIALGRNPDQTLTVPPLANPMQASWYTGSPTPGQIGPSVILGHINGGGKPGIFANLSKVQPGQQISVGRSDGQTAEFTVSHVDLVPKDQFPTNQVYGNTPDAQLRLITCGGTLDRAAHNYLDNVIVYATLTSVHKT